MRVLGCQDVTDRRGLGKADSGDVIPANNPGSPVRGDPNQGKSNIMKKLALTFFAAVTMAAGAHAQLAFTPGNLVVNRLGDGTTALSSTSTNITIMEFTTSGTLVQSIGIPGANTDPNPLSDSGSATSNGYLNAFGEYLFVPAYGTAVGTASVNGTNSTTAPRTAVVFGNDGEEDSRFTAGTGWTQNNFRSTIGYTDSNGNMFVFGSGTASGTNIGSSGVRYFDSSSSSIRISDTVTNTRNLEIYDNELMFSTGSGTTGIYTLGDVDSLDLSSADQNSASLLIAAPSPYGFYVNLTLGVAFVASDAGTNTGGILRYDFNTVTSVWDQTWSFRLDSGSETFTTANSSGTNLTLRGLTGAYDETTETFHLFATTTQTSNNQLVYFTDTLVTSLAAGDSYDVLASAGANYVFRGVDFAPIPEPSTAMFLGVAAMAFLARRRRSQRC